MGAAWGGGAALGSGTGQAGVTALSGADVLSPGCAQPVVGLRHFMPIDVIYLGPPLPNRNSSGRKQPTPSLCQGCSLLRSAFCGSLMQAGLQEAEERRALHARPFSLRPQLSPAPDGPLLLQTLRRSRSVHTHSSSSTTRGAEPHL